MIYVTGDKHGDYYLVRNFCEVFDTNPKDLLIVLGDNGVNFHGDRRDCLKKKTLTKVPITFMMIRGNHDMRPIGSTFHPIHIETEKYAGDFLIEDEFPNILYAIDGNVYRLGDHQAIVMGGAYSVDKYIRLEQQNRGMKGYRWFPDEQLSQDEMNIIEKNVSQMDVLPDLVLAHTCPLRFKPYDKLKDTTVDETMERWFDKMFDRLSQPKWLCGHWHINLCTESIRFMYENIYPLEKAIPKEKQHD